MPKYKYSPEVRAAKQERKEKLRDFLQLLDVEDYSDLRSYRIRPAVCSGRLIPYC